ncbi:MAG: hypothetical protein B6I34_04940 [Anaerolineaceae bacterium 4572_32.1]|nr:MAG: hypothetical protein B6I34_04940 [Anaerolineaceae bacterium 4572_32.1]
MAKTKFPHIDIDRMICALRWLPLLLTPILAYIGSQTLGEIDLTLVLVLVIGGLVYNAVATAMVYFGFFPTAAAWTFLILDVLFSVLEAALRLDLTAALAGAIIITFTDGLGLALTAATISLDTFWPAILGLTTLSLTAGAAGVLIEQIRQTVARARDEELLALQRSNERAQAIYKMSSALSANLDYEQTMDATLEISLMGLQELGLPEESLIGIMLLYGGEGLYVATERHLQREDKTRVVPGQEGIIAQVISEGKAAIGRNLFRDPELSQFVSLRPCRSVIVVPLKVGLDLYGVELVATTLAGVFGEEHKEMVSSVCTQAVVALQNAQLYLDLRQERDNILDQHEEARAQLARDLHDGPTQSISAIAMRLNYVKSLLHRDPPRVRKELDELEALARRTTREIRTMLFTLRPKILETQGLVAAVKQYVDKVQEDADFKIHLQAVELGDALDVNAQTVAFNIIEEAMNNIKKHAHCQNVGIRLALKSDVFITQIQDDGEGFDVEATLASYDQRGSLGLLNLYERAQLVEGKTEIVSAPGKGTTVTLMIPLKK